MMLRRRVKRPKADAELDITSFMNLMIVLVPVLLMMMVFSRITVIELSLPGLQGESAAEVIEQENLEVLVGEEGIAVFFPEGYLIKALPVKTQENGAVVQDWDGLQLILRQLKQTLLAKGAEKQDVTLLINDSVPYQQIVTLLETTRSYKDVVAASVVDAELFPEVGFAEVPADLSDLNAILSASQQNDDARAGGAE
ncbi:ExbD/TolR family protein [Alteromonas sp. H39]|uniref:ExbD/TolR family protein n=1 Tax=Alteromonas sp. H39 TaxID=3389876 RepID=UPI0039DF99CA